MISPVRPLLAWLLIALSVGGCASKPPASDAMLTPAQIKEQATLATQFGNHAAAIAAWQEALRGDPNQREALLGLGQAYLAMGEAQQALPWFERRLATDAKDIEAQEGRALALVGLDRREEALPLLQALVKQTPPRWRSCNAMGLLSDLTGNAEAARYWYQQALAVNPKEASVVNNLGYSRLMAKDYAEAEAHFTDALALSPNAPRLRGNLVLALAWQGDYARAIRYARQWQSEASALNNVGYIALLRGEFDTAIRYFEQALERSPTWYPRAAANLERARAMRLSLVSPGGGIGGAID